MSVFKEILVPTDYSRHAWEAFRVATPCPDGSSQLLRFSSHTKNRNAELAAADAFLAAFEAVGVEGHTDAFVMAAVEDYEKLLRLDLGGFPDAGKPLDLSSKGPLGPWDTLR
jgi:hypothetical protein